MRIRNPTNRAEPIAERLARQAYQMRLKLGPADAPAIAASLIEIGDDRVFERDPKSALEPLREALAIRRKKLNAGHPDIVTAEVRLGEALTATGRMNEAEPVLRQALESAQSAPNPLLGWQIAEVKSALGACLAGQNRSAEARKLLEDAAANISMDPRPAFRRAAAIRLSDLSH